MRIERTRLRRRRGSEDHRCMLEHGHRLGPIRRCAVPWTSDAITASDSLTPGLGARECPMRHRKRSTGRVDSIRTVQQRCEVENMAKPRGIAFEILLLLWRGFAFWTRWILPGRG